MDHAVLPATHVYRQVQSAILAFTPQPHSITTLWMVLISCAAEGSKLSWPGWLGKILRWFIRMKTVTHPIISHGSRESKESSAITTGLRTT